MNTEDVQGLFAYNRWANQRLFSVMEKLPEDKFNAEVQSSFPSIRETVFHILAAEWLWLKRWQGKSPQADAPVSSLSSVTWGNLKADAMPTAAALSTLEALRKFADAIDLERQEFLLALKDDMLKTRLHYHDMSGVPFSRPLGQLLQHVVNHGTYHRGQIMTMLRQVGGETLSLDMSYFFRETEEKAAAG
jgi:uncharacterized damage-inducible protein DinB